MKRQALYLVALTLLLAACSDPSGPGTQRQPGTGETTGETDAPTDSIPYDY